MRNTMFLVLVLILVLVLGACALPEDRPVDLGDRFSQAAGEIQSEVESVGFAVTEEATPVQVVVGTPVSAETVQTLDAGVTPTPLAVATAPDADFDVDVAGQTVTITSEVALQLQLLGYSSFEAFAQSWGLRLGFDPRNGEVDPRETTVCPFELNGCVRLLREKDAQDQIIPFFISNPTPCWHDGWRRERGEVRPGGYTQPDRSGVPPTFSGLVEGITIRACRQEGTGTSGTLPAERAPAVIATAAPPTVVASPTDTSSPPASSGSGGEDAVTNYVHVLEGTVTWQPCEEGKAWCWNTYSNADGQAVSMEILQCAQDGARLVEGKEVVGLPVGTHEVLGATVRPCQ